MGVIMNARGKWSTRAGIVARWFGVEEDAGGRAGVGREVPGGGGLGGGRVVLGSGGGWGGGVGGGVRREVPGGLELRGGQVILVTGASGAGKSTLLQCLRRKYSRRAAWIDLQRVQLPRGALVIDVMAEAQGGGDERD